MIRFFFMWMKYAIPEIFGNIQKQRECTKRIEPGAGPKVNIIKTFLYQHTIVILFYLVLYKNIYTF